MRTPVDERGIEVEQIVSKAVEAALVTPSHQYPTGVLLSAERRHLLLHWLRERRGFAIEDDYDAEFRYGLK